MTERLEAGPLRLRMTDALREMMAFFEQSQWLPAETIRQRQYEELGRLAAYAARESAYFRKRLKRGNLTAAQLTSPEGLRRLPPLTRGELQNVGAALFCKQVPDAHLPLNEGKSSGSTGQPVEIKRTLLGQLYWGAAMMREHAWHGRDFTGRLMNIRAAITQPIMRPDWGPPVSLYHPSGQSLFIPLTYGSQQLADIIEGYKPNHLIIYPSTLKGIIDSCKEQGRTLPSIDHIWCISETLKPETRQEAARFFHARIEDDYSCNEIGIMALQCPSSTLDDVMYHVMAEDILLELLDEDNQPCKEGQIGRVVLTSLHNYATPMIRYDIGDYAQAAGPCRCGRGLPTLRSIHGRRRNLALRPDGTRHFPPLTRMIFDSGLPIRQMQLIQHLLDDVEARLVVNNRFGATEEQQLRRAIQSGMDYPCPVRFTYFDHVLPRSASGKFEDFISHAG